MRRTRACSGNAKIAGWDFRVLDGQGTTQQMTVRATYSDGTDRDVTALSLFQSNNDTSAAVSPAVGP